MDKIEHAVRLAILYLNDIGHRKVALEALDEILHRPYPGQGAGVTLIYPGGTVFVAMRDYVTMLNDVRKGRKLHAIKYLRHVSGMGLKDAKNAIENYDNGFPQDIKVNVSPEQ